jgi:hypothetical protein
MKVFPSVSILLVSKSSSLTVEQLLQMECGCWEQFWTHPCRTQPQFKDAGIKIDIFINLPDDPGTWSMF